MKELLELLLMVPVLLLMGALWLGEMPAALLLTGFFIASSALVLYFSWLVIFGG